MQIYIKTVTGKLTKLLTEPDDTVENIKWKYTVKVGIPVDNQRLVLAGLRLEDDKTLADYNIRHDATLFLTLTLTGK